MSQPASHVDAVHRIYAAFNAHDTDALVACFTADVTVDRGDTHTHTGSAVLKDVFARLLRAYPDARIDLLRNQVLDQDACIVECVFSGTDSGTEDLGGPPGKSALRLVTASFGALLTFDAAALVANVALRGDTSRLLADPEPLPAGAVDETTIRELAARHTTAWSSGDPSRVASNYAESGFIIINGAAPWAGRVGLAAMAGSYMAAFPDLAMSMVSLHVNGDRAVWSWRVQGTNTGPGGTGQPVDFSGYEVWRIDEDGLIAESFGYYDSAAYAHQLEHGLGTDG